MRNQDLPGTSNRKERDRRYREKKKQKQKDRDNPPSPSPVPVPLSPSQRINDEYNIDVDIKSPIQQARKHDQEALQVDGKPNAFRVPVCILCDRLIIGCEPVHKITRDQLLAQSCRISIKSYESHHNIVLKEELISQYRVEGLEKCLLSPRARQSPTKEGDSEFDACSQCAKSWARICDSPPKHAISNGFAIGSIPANIIANDEVTEEMSAILSPVRPFGYIFAYTAGAHRAIRGHFSFFEVDLDHTGAVMNHFLKTGANPLVYVVLCGRMTPAQKQIVKDRARLDTEKVVNLLDWFVTKSGHPAYKHVMPPRDCPQPTLIIDEDTTNNTDQEKDPDVEHSFAGSTFHFTSAHEPQSDTGVYDTQQKFVKAMLDRTMPTLLVSGTNYADLSELQLENIAPFQFPFGQGGPKVERRTRISPLECYRHYCRLSLPQFFRGDFILVLHHMTNRLQSYNSAMITCRSNSFGATLAEKISTLKMKDIQQAIYEKETGQRSRGTAAEYIEAITASCKPVGYCALNAKMNRRKHFAVDAFLGNQTIFLTTSPCDECTIRVQIFAEAGNEVSLPNLRDWDDREHMRECMINLELRKRTRARYPGACSLVYQHLMQIVTECLIGWDSKTQTGRMGVFGVPLAYSRTDEEQGRKTLHSHWQVWIKRFNRCRNALFHSDEATRKAARKALLSYIDKVICASYGTDFVVTHNCGTDPNQQQMVTMPMHQILQEAEDKNILRMAQHQDHCLDIKGRVLSCRKCNESFSTAECVNMGISHLRQQQQPPCLPTSQDQDKGDANSSPMKKEWLDLAVIRYPYDFDEEGMPTDALNEQLLTTDVLTEGNREKQISHKWLHDRALRRDILHFAVDEHNSTHRTTCFKNKVEECRGNLPEMASEETVIFDNDEIDNIRRDLRQNQQDEHNSNENRVVLWHHLDGTIEEKSQYTVLPKRANGSQFLNQHSLPISDVLGCNTNVTVGDPSHTYYTTLYKSKDTQAEDKMAFQRVNVAMGRRLWRHQQQQQQQQQEEAAASDATTTATATTSTTEQNAGTAGEDTGSTNDKQAACHIEGLGRVITGINALLSRDVVSSTMAHLLICQKERFTYSHGFVNLSLRNMENILEEKEGMHFKLRRNWDRNGSKSKRVTWVDCAAYDYIYRPSQLEYMCLYEYTMWFKKVYKTFKQMNQEQGTRQSRSETYSFIAQHSGKNFCHLVKRKHFVIPILNMPAHYMCNIKELHVLDKSPDESTELLRERYAKTAMMLFYPFRQAKDLQNEEPNGTYWEKFVAIGGTVKYDEDVGLQTTTSQAFWNYGRSILDNLQTRVTVEKEMKRPDRKITYYTEKPSSNGRRKKEGVDKNEEYDMDINDLFPDMNRDGDDSQMGQSPGPKPLSNTDLRSHKVLMKRANICAGNVTRTVVNESASVLAAAAAGQGDSDEIKKDRHRENENEKEGTTSSSTIQQNQNAVQSNITYNVKYDDLLTFVQGSLLVGTGEGSSEMDVDMDGDDTSTSTQQNKRNKIPTLHDFARGANSQYNLDDKQYIAYQIVCCTFLLQLVEEGSHHDTRLGEALGTALGPMKTEVHDTKEALVRDLKRKGAKDQLIMFLTGAAGCGKSVTMEAAQLYAHKFCTSIAAAFNDYTFYFTATTGSAAALYGGTTIHSAAHLNRTRLTDDMREIWRDDVRILVIDEISFFTAGDIAKLDRQLKKLTGRHDMVYGGVSIVFSGDFHQLKPICTEDNVLYSDSPAAASWENTLNCAIFLNNSHRFKDDPLYGEILARMRMGQDTLADRQEINKRVVGTNSVTLPENAPDACVACATNKERNGVTAADFLMHIEETHPNVNDESLPPDHTLIIEASTTTSSPPTDQRNKNSTNKRKRRGKSRQVSAAVHDTIVTRLGDTDIRATGFKNSGAKIEPALRIYPGSHHMCITNDDLDKGRGNGTLCKCLKVKLKEDGRERRWKNWDGKKVWTVPISSVEWVEFEHYPVPTSANKPRTFKLAPQAFSATIKFPLSAEVTVTLGNAEVTQIPVNSNIATTVHKLQGMSKDILIVNSWNYRCENWIYTVLSRERKLEGLYLITPLDLERSFNVPQQLLRFEEHLRERKERPVLDMLGYSHLSDDNN